MNSERREKSENSLNQDGRRKTEEDLKLKGFIQLKNRGL